MGCSLQPKLLSLHKPGSLGPPIPKGKAIPQSVRALALGELTYHNNPGNLMQERGGCALGLPTFISDLEIRGWLNQRARRATAEQAAGGDSLDCRVGARGLEPLTRPSHLCPLGELTQ